MSDEVANNDNFLDFDDEDNPTIQSTAEQQLTEEEIRNNPFISLVEYNMGRGSPVSQFFNTFEENSRDPFKAATNLSIGFSTKMQGLDEQTKRSHLEFVINSQAQRLSSALDSYSKDIEQATGYTSLSGRIETYKSPSGFITRPTQYDTFSLLANKQARDMGLRMSMYQLQEVYTVAGIAQRRASTEIVTQSFINSDYSAKGLGDQNTQRSMRVLVGNDVTINVLENRGISAIGAVMPEGANLHAKVGYLYNTSNNIAETAFISTQNITSALPRAHTTEEMLVLRRGDIYRSYSQNPNSYSDAELNRRESIRGRLIDEIKAVTDAIYSAAADQQHHLRSGANAMLQANKVSHTKTLEFRDKVIKEAKKNFTGLNALDETSRSVFIGDEIQRQILRRVQDAANDSTGNKKVVLSIQYLENIFYTDTTSTDSYQKNIASPFLRALNTLAQQNRLSLATSATSFASRQGLFSLLDDYHAGKIQNESRAILTTLLEKNAFSLLPTKFAHSKSFAILNNANGLDVYGIGSANWGANAHLNNVEATLILDQTTMSGLTSQEQKEIASYYYYGVSNFGSRGQQGSFTEGRGSDIQTKKLISLLLTMGGKESRERISNEPFIFSRRYDINRKGQLSGLDIQLPGLEADGKGYSFSVTVGQEFGQQGYQPVVYLSKNNRVINGMIYKNDSKQVLKLYNGVELAPGETRQFGALEVVAGLISTMQHTMKFEASNRSLQVALTSMSSAARQQALSNVLGSLAQQHAQDLGLLRWTDTPGQGLDKTFQAISSRRGRRNFLQRLMGSSTAQGIERVLLELSGRLQLPLAESSLGVENSNRLAERVERIRDILKPDKASYSSAELQGLASTIVKSLDRLLMSSLGNNQTSTLYHDLLRQIVNQDDVARDLYNRSQQTAKRELFSQQTSPFMQPHELRYSFGQALYKTPVFGINDELYSLAEAQGTLGFLLSPHALRHGESLGGSYIRAIADSVRLTESDLYKNQGGIYKAEGGAATIRDTEAMLNTMRGIGILRRADYADQVLTAFKEAGLSPEMAKQRAKEQEEEVFRLLNVRGSSSSSLFYFPYRVTEQISQRLKNLQSGRPVEAASRAFGRYADTLGVFGSTADTLRLESMLAGNVFTSLPEHQFRYLQQLLKEHDKDPTKVLNYIKRNIHGDSMSLVRGFLGGTSPKRVLQSMGISTMSDFAYVNEKYKDASGRPEYTLLHKTTMTLDAARLQGNASFEQLVKTRLTRGVTFLAKDTLIEDSGLRSLLEGNVLRQLGKMGIEGLDNSLPFTDLMQRLDADNRKKLEGMISLQFETVQFKSSQGKFYFRKGVHSAAVGDDGSEERLASKKIIGQLEESKGYFTIDGLYEYQDLGGQQKGTQLLKFKLPAVSQRLYRGVTVLHEDPRISQTGSSTITLELETSTRRDMMSGLRYGSDTSKGPNYVLAGDLFDQLAKDGYSGTDSSLLPERLRSQSIYAILSPSQIKGFNFEQGLMLIEDRRSSSFLDFIKGNKGGAAVAEGLALMMLGEKVGTDSTLSRLLGEHLKDSGRSQAALALLKPGKSKHKGLPTRGDGDSLSDATRATYQIFGELSSLALPQFLNDTNLSTSKALVKTVSLALGKGREANEARQHLQNRALRIFEGVRRRTDAALEGVQFDPDRYIFSDSFDSRSASVLAYLVKAGQDLLGNIDINQRLEGGSISEINPAYFMGDEGKAKYLGLDSEADPRTRNAMLASVRRVASGLGVHLPTPEEILSATSNKETLEKQLQYGLAQVNAMLRFNRFLEFGIEQLPSKIAVAVGMQNMTKMEGQYALELSRRQVGLYTNTFDEKQDVLSIQQAVLLLGGLMEGQLPDPYRASTLYGLKVTNLATMNTQVGISKAMRFATTFLSNFSRVAEKTLPTVVAGKRGFSSPLAKDAVLAYLYGTKAEQKLIGKMGLIRQLAGGMVMPSFQDAEYGIDYRRRQIEHHILQELKVDPEQRKAIKNEVVSIIAEFNKAHSNNPALASHNVYRKHFIDTELRRTVENRALAAQYNKQSLLAPLAYYKNFFSNLTTSVISSNPSLLTNLPTEQTNLDIVKFINDDLLRASGVYEHYQADINRRISAAQNTESGMEYLHYGMEVLKSVSLAQSHLPAANELYKTISRTQRLVLPALISHGMNDGRHIVSYAPTTSTSPNQGLLLGLDIMQKISLVFQGQSHAALSTQVALSEQLTSSYDLLEKLSNPGTSELNDYELEQYRRLEFLMRESIETTAQLLNNQETIRQAATDRLKLSGMSAIAMSSLLLSDDEVAFGKRFTEATQKGHTTDLKVTLKRSREALVKVSKSINTLNQSIEYLEGKIGTTVHTSRIEKFFTPKGQPRSRLITPGYTPQEGSIIQERTIVAKTGSAYAELRTLENKNREVKAIRQKMQQLIDSARKNKSLNSSEYALLESFLLRDVTNPDGTISKKGYVTRKMLSSLGLEYEAIPATQLELWYDPINDPEKRDVRVKTDIATNKIKTGKAIHESYISSFEKIVSEKLKQEQDPIATQIAEKKALIAKHEAKLKENKNLLPLKESQQARVIDTLVSTVNKQRRAYHLQKYGQDLAESEYITRSHISPLIDGYNIASTTEFLDYTTRLITSRQISTVEKVNIPKPFPIFLMKKEHLMEQGEGHKVFSLFVQLNKRIDSLTNSLKERTKAAIDNIESLYNSSSTNVRQGAPYAASLEARSGTALLGIVEAETSLAQRARDTNTLVIPAGRESSTLMLVSALGMHYTQMGDNDGDSFQGAITKLADITRRIQQQQAEVDKLKDDRANLQHDYSFAEDQLKAIRNAEIKDADARLSSMIEHKNQLVEEHRKIKAEVRQRAKEGLRAFTTTYTAIPSEMMGEGGVFTDESLQSLVKQYRDTLDGIYGNTKHAVDAVGSLNAEILSKLQLSKQNGEYRVTGIEGYTRNAQTQKLFDSVISEFDYYYQNLENKNSLSNEQEVIAAIINQQALAASSNASFASNDKRVASAMGSILDAQGIYEIQSILGASGTGLLGSTYNTVVPLVALKMGEITAQRTLKGNNGASYRMAMAASLTREINRLKKQQLPNQSPDPSLDALIKQLEARRNSYFHSGETLATRLRLADGHRQLETAMRFVTTTQQFLRDAGIKPKEPKSGQRKTTMLEEADNYTLPVDDLRNYGVQLLEGEETVRGLTNIFERLTGDDQTIRDNRENILTRFLGDRVGNDLDIYLGQGSDSSNVESKQAKAFAALKLMTEYVSGNFEDTSAMLEGSVFTDLLKRAQTDKRYSGLATDEFIPKFITDLTSAFQSEYILNNVIEIENRLEFAKTGKEIQELYGIKPNGNYDQSAIDRLVDKRRSELITGSSEVDSAKESLNKHLAAYRTELEGRRAAIDKATSGLTEDFEIFEAALKASVNMTIEYDRANLESSIVELKALHDAFGQMREGGVPSNLEQDLALYTTAFTQQLASGKIDTNIWMGFYSQALPEIARLANNSVDETNPNIKKGEPRDAAFIGFFSMLGLQETSIGYGYTDGNSEQVGKIESRASTYVITDEYIKLNLAREYTEFTNPNANSEALRTELSSLGEEGKYLSALAESVLIKHAAIEGQANEAEYKAGLEAIKSLELNKSAAEYAADQSAFTYTMSKLNQEYTNLVAEQAANLQSNANERIRQQLNTQYENSINSVLATIQAYEQNPQLVPRANAIDSINQTVQDIQEQLNRNLTATIERAQEGEVKRVERASRRAHSMSEAISVLAVPALFALMQNRASASEQAIEMLSNTAQSYLSSTAVAGGEGELVKTAEKLRTARIRNNLSTGGGTTESLLTGIAFESIFHTSSLVSNKVMGEIETRGAGGFAATPLGRLTGEVIGGVVGMSLAGILTHRKAGLPGESVTDQDLADRIIEGIKQSTREAAERFSEQVIAQTTADVFDEEDGATVSSSLDYSSNNGFLTAMELDELTGVTVTTYEGDEIPTYMET